MNITSWQELSIRLLFAFILGSATAVEKKWYLTKQRIQSNIFIALGAAMFSILSSLASTTIFAAQMVLGISIICVGGVFWHKQENLVPSDNINIVLKLWCAGAAGSLVGYGLFVPAYVGIIIILLTSLIFPATETNFVPNLQKVLPPNSKSKDKLELKTKAIIPQEIYYQCQVDCLAVNEAEVLALLVQLGKEQQLTPTKISSKDLVSDRTLPEIEIRVDFISDKDNNPLQLQQLLIKLKSEAEVSSAIWLNLSSELRANHGASMQTKKNLS